MRQSYTKREARGNLFTALGAVDKDTERKKEFVELLRVSSLLLDMGHEAEALSVHRVARKQYPEVFKSAGYYGE